MALWLKTQVEQDCHIFLGTTYQNGDKYNIGTVKYSKCPYNVSIFCIPRPSKIYPIGDFFK
jgi:hypothetical protein